jgi:YHS domain-containing protein
VRVLVRSLLAAALIAAAWVAAPLVAAPAAARERPGKPSSEAQESFDTEPPPGTMAKCPVTGDTFRVNAQTVFVKHEGRVYAFCCEDCAAEFKASPSKFGG